MLLMASMFGFGVIIGYCGKLVCESILESRLDLVSDINALKGDLIAAHLKLDKLLQNMVQGDSSLL